MSLTGLLYSMDDGGLLEKFMKPSARKARRLAGLADLRPDANRNFGLSLLGRLGATIVYSALASSACCS